MKRTILPIFLTILFACITSVSVAQNSKEKKRFRLQTEWGVIAGAYYPIMDYKSPEGTQVSLKPLIGFSGGLHMALIFDEHFAIQPELLYSYGSIKLQARELESDLAIKNTMQWHTFQVPILFSLRYSVFRFNIGPVLSFMEEPKYKDADGQTILFGRINPTVSYTAGVGVKLFKHLLLDLRYIGRFNKMDNFLSFRKDKDYTIKTTGHNLQLKIGYAF